MPSAPAGARHLLLALLLAPIGAQAEETPAPAAVAVPATLEPGEGNDVAEEDAAPEPFVATGDLAAIQKRGVLRVLDEGPEESFLPRDGRAASHDRELLREFARRRGLRVQFIAAESFTDLLPMLLEGRGDLVADDLTVTPERAAQVAFTRPTATVSEVVVGRQGGPAPKGLAEVEEIHVRASSSYALSLEKAKDEAKLALRIVAAPEGTDPEELVYEVTRGQRPLTVIDSHLLARIAGYNGQVRPLFPIAEGRQIAWAVRRTNPDLRAALDAFIVEKALTQHAAERSTGDLDEIRRRGALRVLTRNNAITYFLHRGQRFGFDYELARMAAKSAGLRLEMVVVPSRDQLVPWLLEGRGDLIAAGFTNTPERGAQVAFTKPYLFADEVLVQRTAKRAPKVKRLEDLKGRRIHVRRSSSYHRTLTALQETYGPFELVPVDEDVETEELLERLVRGEIDFTVADTHILQVEQVFRSGIEAALTLPVPAGEAAQGGEGSREIAFAVRPGNPQLQAFLDAYVKKSYRGLEYNMARRRYFENKRSIDVAKTQRARAGELSPFDAIIRRHAKTYGFDWRLMAAQAYQESRFDPQAKSWVGARGLFQVMPATGGAMGFTDLENPEIGTHAGIRYMHKLLQQLDPKMQFKQRMRFALAAYNVGLGHVLDAQRLAAEKGLDPNKWFGHVEKAMLLLQKPQYAARARHGYCRGEEPVKYVSEIQNRYDNYVKIVPE